MMPISPIQTLFADAFLCLALVNTKDAWHVRSR